MDIVISVSFPESVSRGWLIFEIMTGLLALATAPSVLLQCRGRPRSALAWLLALMALPFVGVVFWWGFGRNHLDRKKRRRNRALSRIEGRLSTLRDRIASGPGEPPEALRPLRKLLESDDTGIFYPSRGNRTLLLPTTEAAYDLLEEAIRRAEHHIHLLFYIWEDDESGQRFCDLLTEKARQGVEVRLLYDAVGSPRVLWRFMRKLREAGGHAKPFLPLYLFGRRPTWNFRNHRKIVVVDGRFAMTGSFNIGDAYLHDRHDIGIALEGPAVRQVQEVFADDWYFTAEEDLAEETYFTHDAGGPWLLPADASEATCAIIASGPERRENNPTHDAYFLAITTARKRILITTPYFIPDTGIIMALRGAVLRGVDVRLMLPHQSDIALARMAARSYYPELLASGVRIYEHVGRFLHSKCLVFDDELAILGSANVDNRSFLLNFEASCLIYSEETNRQLAEMFAAHQANAIEVTQESLAYQSRLQRLGDSVANLLAPMM